MADWATISSLATAGGTLVLAGATFAAVRSSNRAAQAAERSAQAAIRPLLLPSQLGDPLQKVHFMDGKWLAVEGGRAAIEATDEAVYLVVSLRNVGNGIAVLHSWLLHPTRLGGRDDHEPLERFVRLTRDLYIAEGELGFWQGTFRDPRSPEFVAARAAIEAREAMSLDLLYGDHEGGQRVIVRLALWPREDGGWMTGAARHWNLDRADPR